MADVTTYDAHAALLMFARLELARPMKRTVACGSGCSNRHQQALSMPLSCGESGTHFARPMAATVRRRVRYGVAREVKSQSL
jgi:hypothetical protein